MDLQYFAFCLFGVCSVGLGGLAIILCHRLCRGRFRQPVRTHIIKQPRLKGQRLTSAGSLRDSCQRKCPIINYLKYTESSKPICGGSVETIYSTPAVRGLKRQLSSDTYHNYHVGLKYLKCGQGAVLCVKIPGHGAESLTKLLEIANGMGATLCLDFASNLCKYSILEDFKTYTVYFKIDRKASSAEIMSQLPKPNADNSHPVTPPYNANNCTGLIKGTQLPRKNCSSKNNDTPPTLRAACSLVTLHRDRSFNSLLQIWQAK